MFALKNLTKNMIKVVFAVIKELKLTYDGSQVINIELHKYTNIITLCTLVYCIQEWLMNNVNHYNFIELEKIKI